MMSKNDDYLSPEEHLKGALDSIRQEEVRLMIMGRGYTPEEEKRLQVMSEAKKFIEEALKVLEGCEFKEILRKEGLNRM